jgi:hypothetical protein
MPQSAILDQPISKEEASTTISIYPNGTGAFACGNPDGPVLQDGQALEVLLGSHWIAGFIEQRPNETPKFIVGKTSCGLCAGMQVRLPAVSGREKYAMV